MLRSESGDSKVLPKSPIPALSPRSPSHARARNQGPVSTLFPAVDDALIEPPRKPDFAVSPLNYPGWHGKAR